MVRPIRNFYSFPILVGYLAIINIFDTNKWAGGITTGKGGVCAALAVIMSIMIWIFAAEVLSLTVMFNLKKKSIVILPNIMLDLCREDIRNPMLIHLLDQGEHLGISSVLGPPDLASLCRDGQEGQKTNC